MLNNASKMRIALFYFFSNCLLQCICQFVNRQSDRFQLKFVDISAAGTGIWTFSTPFKNTPLVTYNIKNIDYTPANGFSFNIYTTASSTTSVSYQVTGASFTLVSIAIIATDYPNQQLFTFQTVPSQSQTYGVSSNIIGYCKYLVGYSGSGSGAISVGLATSISGNSITISVSGTMTSVSYNILVFYQSSVQIMLLYSFQTVSQTQSGTDSFSITFGSTGVASTDAVSYSVISWSGNVSSSLSDFYIQVPLTSLPPSSIQIDINKTPTTSLTVQIEMFSLIMRVCPSGSFIIYQGTDYQCTSNCPSINNKTYNDSVNTFTMDYSKYTMYPCSPCNAACYGCTGPNNNQCTSCTTGQYLDTSTSTCVASQPASSYCISNTIDSENYSSCQPCYSTCLTCSGILSNQCSSCISANPYLQNGTCFASQPVSTFCNQVTVNSITNYNCSSCYSTCYSCTDANNNQCTSCKSANPYLYNGQCVTSQPTSSYCTSATQNTQSYQNCQICFSTCFTCSGGTSGDCTSCVSASPYLFNGTCVNTQPAQSFCTAATMNSQSYQSCSSCNSTCQTCTGSGSSQCTSCLSTYPYSYQGSCLNSQPASTYCQTTTINSQNYYSCQTCAAQCNTCSGPGNQCTSCTTGFPYFFNSNCFSSQPTQTYCATTNVNSIINYQCSSCDSSCNTCSGGSSNQCTSCQSSNLYVYIGVCVDENTLSGVYCDTATHICQNCVVSNCIRCDSTLLNCDECMQGYFNYY